MTMKKTAVVVASALALIGANPAHAQSRICGPLDNMVSAEPGCKVSGNAGYRESLVIKAYPSKKERGLSLKKTVIFVTGLDPFGQMTAQDWLDAMNTHGLIDQLRDDGHAVLFMTFGESSRHPLHVNAAVLVQALNGLEQYGMSSESRTVVGLGMGGLIARMALRSMESATGNYHNVQTFVSFDAPHQGLNIPLGAQRVQRYLNFAFDNAQGEINLLKDFGTVSVPWREKSTYSSARGRVIAGQPVLTGSPGTSKATAVESNVSEQLLESPVSQQLLINQLESNSVRADLLSSLASKGYPKQTYNVAFANGSATGQANALGETLLSYAGEVNGIRGINLRLDFQVKATSPRPASVFAASLTGPRFYAEAPQVRKVAYFTDVYHSYVSKPEHQDVDRVPGSYAESIERLADWLNQGRGSLPPLTPSAARHTFVPTYSALDIDLARHGVAATASLQSIASGRYGELSKMTPFQQVFVPGNGANEAHLAMTAEKTRQLLQVVTKRKDFSWLVPMLDAIED
jgi:hypothetical protein